MTPPQPVHGQTRSPVASLVVRAPLRARLIWPAFRCFWSSLLGSSGPGSVSPGRFGLSANSAQG
eukprot:3069823-Pyramimonas_sp.AAC.1